jgi:hypothetical protein
MTTAMTNSKKQWVKPEVRHLEGAEAEKARSLIFAAAREAVKDHPEEVIKRRAG